MGQAPTTELFSRPEDAARAKASAALLHSSGYTMDPDGLIQALASQELIHRTEAAFLIGYARAEDCKDALLTATGDSEARVRAEAALALGRLGDMDGALPVLRAELPGQFFAGAPLRAARALALLGDPSGYQRVMEALSSPFPSNRMEAVLALPAFLPYAGQVVAGRQVDPVAALAVAAHDPEEIVRRDTFLVLSRIDDPRALRLLQLALEDPEPRVRNLAERALREEKPLALNPRIEA